MTNENIITKDEAIARKKAELPCKTRCIGGWYATKWADFDDDENTYCKPPEPRRLAREWKDVTYICTKHDTTFNQNPVQFIHVREVLPGDVTLGRMTEKAAVRAFHDWQDTTNGEWTYTEVWLASRRALGLIGEGS